MHGVNPAMEASRYLSVLALHREETAAKGKAKISNSQIKKRQSPK